MLNVFNTQFEDEYLTIAEAKDLISDLLDNGFDSDKILYSYGLLGFLHTFKVTAKGLSCYDSLGNYTYFKDTSKYLFNKSNWFASH